MPGSSLWLVPPSNSSIEDILSTLITKTVPSHFPELKAPPHFPPHLTLTTDIPTSVTDEEPQKWLDDLSLSVTEPPSVSFQSLDVGRQFFRKLTLGVSKASLRSLAVQVRAAAVEDGNEVAAKQWAEESYLPHVSLLYADIEIQDSKRRQIIHDLEKAGIQLMKGGSCGALKDEGYNGWTGGRIVLVSTWKELKDWSIVAERSL